MEARALIRGIHDLRTFFCCSCFQTGKSVVASVRVAQGALKSGSKALLLPVGDVAVIKSIEVEGRMKDSTIAGEHADLTIMVRTLETFSGVAAPCGGLLAHCSRPYRPLPSHITVGAA